jgi:hypothetical protein
MDKAFEQLVSERKADVPVPQSFPEGRKAACADKSYRELVSDMEVELITEASEVSELDAKFGADFMSAVGCNLSVMESIDSMYRKLETEYKMKVAGLDVLYKTVRDKRHEFFVSMMASVRTDRETIASIETQIQLIGKIPACAAACAILTDTIASYTQTNAEKTRILHEWEKRYELSTEPHYVKIAAEINELRETAPGYTRLKYMPLPNKLPGARKEGFVNLFENALPCGKGSELPVPCVQRDLRGPPRVASVKEPLCSMDLLPQLKTK